MFKRKRTKIAEYLRSAPGTAFAQLLSDWYGGTMHSELEALGLTKLDDHIDWLPDTKCISIQARYGKLYVDFTDPDPYMQGMVGVRTHNCSAEFDDLTVKPID